MKGLKSYGWKQDQFAEDGSQFVDAAVLEMTGRKFVRKNIVIILQSLCEQFDRGE